MLVEHSTLSLSRSKSDNDLMSISDPGSLDSCDSIRRTLIRQGAIRKRTPDFELNLNKRNSVLLNKNEFSEPLSLFVNHSQLNIDKDSPKRTKNSLSSFAIVKEKWKSLKKDNKGLDKEDVKKKVSEMKTNSSSIFESPPKVYNPDINMFLPKLVNRVSLSGEEPIILIDSSWEVLVNSTKNMTKSEVDGQAAIWEIIDTEANFIKQLAVLVHVFYPVLQKLLTNYHCDLLGIDIEEVFGNITDVYQSHLTLWNNCISVPLTFSRMSREPLDILLMKEGFCSISKTLSSYVHLMRCLPAIRKTIGKLQRESCVFKQYIEWTQQYSRLCNDGHMSILSLPFQRITRYKLLLERVKSIQGRDNHADIDEMMSSVHMFLQQVDSLMIGKYSMKDLKEKIVVSLPTKDHWSEISRIVNEESLQFDILTPLNGFHERILILEGRLKLKECCNKSSDVQCYLCNDLFMVCKPIKGNWDKLKISRGPIRLDKLVAKEKCEGFFVMIVYNDFKIVDSTMILGGDVDEVKLWIDKCQKAKATFMTQFIDDNQITMYSKRNSVETTISTQDEFSFDENLGILKHSETNSSGYSTDSAFSQASSCSTQTDLCCADHSMLGNSQGGNTHSAENLTSLIGVSLPEPSSNKHFD